MIGEGIKFNLHTCYVGLGQLNEAMTLLQSIPAKVRTEGVSWAWRGPPWPPTYTGGARAAPGPEGCARALPHQADPVEQGGEAGGLPHLPALPPGPGQ